MTDSSVYGLWFGCGLVYHRKIRLTQLWVELSWVVAISNFNLSHLTWEEQKGARGEQDLQQEDRERHRNPTNKYGIIDPVVFCTDQHVSF